MAAEAGLLQAKVAKLLSRRFGKPVLKPKLPLVLNDQVSNRKTKLAEASCLREMSVLMACWKESSFNDKVCSNEIKVFYKCVTKAQADRKAGLHQELPTALLPPDKVNRLLRKYPSIKHEI
ncbi:coiled-coil-helix-coiled-coil-helix domain-containing protein 1 [Rana temporaria]|uniref:coiled-coil-helix-coiled-coil-helix domain-containing protein 1 n=1 Tax=Rana temporaria TaxID=8407 RepID=UPI001AACB2F9|nr:coiled-coil-helix-coiled-coil-helix domain-containing protein 1 [Rana temporaria]